MEQLLCAILGIGSGHELPLSQTFPDCPLSCLSECVADCLLMTKPPA
jgi:hypothetical protein